MTDAGKSLFPFRCQHCGNKGDNPRDFAWYPSVGGYLCLNKASCHGR